MMDNQPRGSALSSYLEPRSRVRGLIGDELAVLLAVGGARAELVDLARATCPSQPDAAENLALLADAAWVAAADERARVDLDGSLRIELLTRAASLATLLRIHIELAGCENVGAERALNLAEELARGELSGREPDAPLPAHPRSSSSRESSGWRAHVEALSSWLRR